MFRRIIPVSLPFIIPGIFTVAAIINYQRIHAPIQDTKTSNRIYAEGVNQSVPIFGVPGTNQERTFIMLKPDAVQRGLIAEILGRFERKGFKVVGLKMVNPDERLIRAHYDDLKARPFFRDLVDYMSSAGPVVAIVLEGKDVVRYCRTMIGETSPSKSPVGSIRGDLATDVSRNIIHGSDAVETAQQEIQLWFTEGEVNNWNKCTAQWQYEDI